MKSALGAGSIEIVVGSWSHLGSSNGVKLLRDLDSLSKLHNIPDMSDSSDMEYGTMERQPSVSGATIDNVGFGMAQLKVAFLAGGVWMADGAEILLVTSTVLAVSSEWGLDAEKRGMCLSLAFLGVLVGSLLSGPVGDRLGRRLPILTSYAGTVVFSLVSSVSRSFSELAACRFFVGLSFGLGQPACSTLVSEVTPKTWRTTTMSFLTSFLFTVGEVYAVFLLWMDDPSMQQPNWRRILALGAIPSALLFCLAYVFLIQSPSYLARNGQHEEATSTLAALSSDNGTAAPASSAKQDVVEAPVSEVGFIDPVSQILSKEFRIQTLSLGFSCVVLNMFMNGSFYIIPQVTLSLANGYTPAFNLGAGVLGELPGGIIAAVAGSMLPRRSLLLLAMSGCAISAALMLQGIRSDAVELQLPIAILMTKATTIINLVSLWSYAAEYYPGNIRTTGLGACLGIGRLGSFLAPVVAEYTKESTGSFAAFYFGLLFLYMLNILLGWLVFVDIGENAQSNVAAKKQRDPTSHAQPTRTKGGSSEPSGSHLTPN